MLYPSGVAAIACALLAVLKPGDELLMVDSAYDPTRAFCENVLRPMGITPVYYDPMIGGGIDALCTGRTRAIFLESPGSLTFEVQDVPAIVAVAKARGIVTLMDNTWATPRSEEHTSELQSLMRISYAVFCLKKKKSNNRLTP